MESKQYEYEIGKDRELLSYLGVTRESFHQAEQHINPINIVEWSWSNTKACPGGILLNLLNENKVIFIRMGKGSNSRIRAMITPISWEYLLQVAEALKDERTFTLVDKKATEEELKRDPF